MRREFCFGAYTGIQQTTKFSDALYTVLVAPQNVVYIVCVVRMRFGIKMGTKSLSHGASMFMAVWMVIPE